MNAVPAYLLDRGEDGTAQPSEQAVAEPSSDDDSCSDECERMERRVDRWNANANALDQCRERELLEERAQRAREAAEWDAARGAERDAEHEALMAAKPDFYWALACEIGRRPKWHLRKGETLEGDATRTMSDEEPLLLYRGFRPFRPDGDVVKASQVFSIAPNRRPLWLDDWLAERILKVEVDLIVEVVAEADRREKLLRQRLGQFWGVPKGQDRHLEHDALCLGLFHASSELERRGLPRLPWHTAELFNQ